MHNAFLQQGFLQLPIFENLPSWCLLFTYLPECAPVHSFLLHSCFVLISLHRLNTVMSVSPLQPFRGLERQASFDPTSQHTLLAFLFDLELPVKFYTPITRDSFPFCLCLSEMLSREPPFGEPTIDYIDYSKFVQILEEYILQPSGLALDDIRILGVAADGIKKWLIEDEETLRGAFNIVLHRGAYQMQIEIIAGPPSASTTSGHQPGSRGHQQDKPSQDPHEESLRTPLIRPMQDQSAESSQYQPNHSIRGQQTELSNSSSSIYMSSK